MSSLAATQADGYYLPPEYYDSGTYKKKSKNQFANSKGHNQFVKSGVARFELPYKGVCLSCKTSIARGTRYNAKKVETGESYFTTKIWEFQMSCRICSHPFRIRTNPQDRGFDYVEGIKIQAGQEPSKELLERTFATNMDIPDALEKLEAAAQGKKKLMTEIDQLEGLQKLNEKTKLNDSASNATIRARFRKDRKNKRARIREAKNLGWREGMEVVGTSLDDQVAAKETVFGRSKETEKKRFGAVKQSSIFGSDKGKRKRRRREREEEEEDIADAAAIFPDRVVSRSVIPLGEPSNPIRSEVNPETDQPKHSKTTGNTTKTRTKRKINPATIRQQAVEVRKSSSPPPVASSFSSMLAGYGSDSEDD
mmetsp:Transcript_28993/g.70020  ORF Transcript_28993/g.70020 Transcript_28993/m.70020 type:complete len:366 (+) Transcript_28993:179-1276(+)|eukprot:CAMPEP_0113618704 /NCGR_PEP_ID=MMETSP0017_2-20120614/9478_1 /TAXON_ID=2856 /ORGANISM="Cylindrotheca closterium" /LENGTH=365 /DNA_ID=CAMNT_0000528229 /DNA_START=80 /DNA_END=1177 /DNA_ORIENTATION=- /assembly_acc=CAM_ASM_000147